MPIIEGFISGLATVVFIGPVLFTLLQITMDKGKLMGLSVAVGIIVSDILIVALFYFNVLHFFELPDTQFWFALIGSVILIGLGLKYIIKPAMPKPSQSVPKLLSTSGAFIKGFLVNFVNPFVFFVWISLIAYSEGNHNGEADTAWYLAATLAGIFTTDVLKVLLASKLSKLLTPAFLRKLYIAIGLILIGFSFRLIYFIVFQL